MKIDKVLLKKFYHGECGEDESRKVYEWLSDPAHEHEVTEMLSTDWDETESDEPLIPVDLDRLLVNIKSKTHHHPTGLPEENMTMDRGAERDATAKKGGTGMRSFVLYKFAAGVVSVLIISGLLYKLFFSRRNKH